MKQSTEIKFNLACDQVKSLVMDEFIKANPDCTMEDISQLGITMDEAVAKAADYVAAMDASPNPVTTPSNVTPVQFAQYWLTNPIKIITRARSLDKVVGRTVVGTWETEQIVATILERMGQPDLYGDFTKAPLANWNLNFETRDNVRFEMGIEVGKLEELRASQMRMSAYAMKRDAMAEGFAILMNNVGWWGYRADSKNFAGSSKKIYGLLNNPGTTAYDMGTASWKNYTMREIVSDIQSIVNTAVERLVGHYDPETDYATLALPISQFQYLSTISDYGVSVMDWLKKTYPKVRVVSCAELVKAVSDADTALFIVDRVVDDDTVQQMVTSSLRLVGVQPLAKGSYEVYSCSTAGSLLRYPLAMSLWRFRATGTGINDDTVDYPPTGETIDAGAGAGIDEGD